jgi:hypothetical protein
MPSRKTTGTRGARGPAGPAGPTGRTGKRGARGAKGRSGARGKTGAIGAAGSDNRTIIKTLDGEIHGLYRELNAHLHHLKRVQGQLEGMRQAIRKLGASIKD